MIGRSASARIVAASAIASIGTAGAGGGGKAGIAADAGQGARIRSWGRNRADGRGRPQVIAWNARPTSAGTWSTRRSVPHHWVTGLKIPSRSIS